MKKTLQRFFLTIVIYLSACACTVFFITPYSFTSFIGPAAGITTALVIVFGVKTLLAITVATILFCFYLFYSLGIEIELSMIVISLLAIMLQGGWAKPLTLREVTQYNWLKSRQHLFCFLFKIGPLISLVSAFAVTIVIILESKTIDENLFFIFVDAWSGSILFSIFFTPIMLLSQGRQQLDFTKRIFTIMASLLVVVSIGSLFKISQSVQLNERQNTFIQVKNNVLQVIQKEIDMTIDSLNSLSAFFQASDAVDILQFNSFAQQIFQPNSSVRVLEWAPITSHKDRADYERKYSVIIEKNSQGNTQKAENRSRYAPIRYIYPYRGNESIIGLDVLADSTQSISLDDVISSEQVIASAPINLIQDNHANLGVLFVSAVFSDTTNNNINIEQERSDNLLGFVIAVVQFKNFFQQISLLQDERIDLFVEDVTAPVPFVLFGRELNESHRHVEKISLQVHSRQWQISLGEHQPWQLQPKNLQVWGMLFGATFAGVLFQVLILMLVVYTNELNSQVMRRTRELIAAKDQAESTNAAKTNFLNTLSHDLQTPLHAIKGFCQQFPEAKGKESEKLIQSIEFAQCNMQKLLNMVVDLSKIERGESEVNNASFDFHGFLERIDDMISARKLPKDMPLTQQKKITFLIDENVPPFIISDAIKIQQILIALFDGVHALFKNNNIRLTVKVRSHRFNSATLLFVFTSNDDEQVDNTAPFDDFLQSNIALFNTQMALAKEVCQLMEGDVNLGVSDSGERVLTAAIKILITLNEPQHT